MDVSCGLERSLAAIAWDTSWNSLQRLFPHSAERLLTVLPIPGFPAFVCVVKLVYLTEPIGPCPEVLDWPLSVSVAPGVIGHRLLFLNNSVWPPKSLEHYEK